MREITQLIVHCAATKAKMDIGANEIRRWHKDRGWADIGYHFVVRRDGDIEAGRPETIAGAHVAGHNAHSIGICLVGGIDDEGNPETNFTTQQFWSLRRLLEQKLVQYGLEDDAILGHRDVKGVAKSCPCFDVRHWWQTNEIKP